MKDEQLRAELLKMADGRLHPSITNPNYLVLRRRRLILGKWMESIPGQQLVVLDIGGRYQPYRPLLEHRIQRYFGLDILRTPFVDAIGSGDQLPFKADTFDVVIATGVFEFFPEPRVAAAEIHRILKPGGSLLMSVSAICPRAVEGEIWHYLPNSLKYILAPFSKIEIVPEVTSVGGTLRLNAVSLSIFAKYEFIRKILHHTVVPVLNAVGLVLEGAGISQNDQITGNYSVLAQK
jgi:SAM-dependent methyltransferase